MQARATPRGVSSPPPAAAAALLAAPCRRAAALRRPRRLAAAPSDLLVLDFDGVLVDSEPEVSVSALGAASARWPEAFGGGEPRGAAREALLAGLKRSRPVLVGGYESMCMVRIVCLCIANIVCACIREGATAKCRATNSQHALTLPVAPIPHAHAPTHQARLLAEDGDSWRRILADWPALLPASLERWGEDPAALIKAFEKHRRARAFALF
jgi:hypothetical protein